MSNFRYPKTEWGIKIMNYAQSKGITLKELARRAEVNYNTLLQVRIGKTPGENAQVVDKINSYINENQ